MHAYCLEYLAPLLKPGAKCLDIGCGSGIFCSYLSAACGSDSTVVGVDHIPELVTMSKDNCEKDCPDALASQRVQLYLADGRKGFAAEAPYDWYKDVQRCLAMWAL
eukprot:m.44259 g.44259  ORF g.44259 m.44259 type:complete len:106 (-) comp10826_c0_seq4:603-920(-)